MRASLHAKVFAVISLIAVSLVLGLTGYFSQRHQDSTRREFDERLQIYVALAARELEPVVVSRDQAAARDIFEALAVDDELSAIAVYGPGGDVIAGRGVLDQPSVVRITRPVKKGHVVLELSTRLSDAEITAANSSAFLVAIIALVVGLGGAWLIARHYSNRIGGLASAASKIAASDASATSAPLAVGDNDEIGRLSGSFNTMVNRLLAAQSREIELLLAHVVKGLVIVDRDGRMGARHSAVMDRWFGDVKQGAKFWSLFRGDPRTISHLELAWEGLFDDFLPDEVAVDQFPKRLRHGEKTFALTVHPMRNDEGVLESALVTLVDVTDELRREESDAARSDLVALCERAVTDRSSVIDFLSEGDALHRVIEIGETRTDLHRAVHTLKGVAAQAGAARISDTCDAIERGMAEAEDGAPKPADIAALATRWALLTSPLRTLFANAEPTLAVTLADAEALLASIAGFEPHAVLARKTRMLMLEPMQIRLDRVKEGARVLAGRVGKQIEVTGSAHGLRCDPVVWTPFWSELTHVVRNALDHGIETPDVREANGKCARGQLSVNVMNRKTHVVVEVEEDGAGIDWAAVQRKARAAGWPASMPRDLEQALFADGFSTRDVASELSGRGLGLAAVRAVTERMGGSIRIISTRGAGTTMRFTFPLATLGAAYAEEELRVAA